MVIHPYGPAIKIRFADALDQLRAAGAPRPFGLALAAIGLAATGLDLRAVVADQLHGRLAVGMVPIDYFGPKYQTGLRLAGLPGQLAAGMAAQQATAAVAAWTEFGLAYWPEFASGAYRDVLSAVQLRQLPARIDGRPPGSGVEAAGQAAGVVAMAQAATALPSLQAATAAVTQLHNTIGATTNG